MNLLSIGVTLFLFSSSPIDSLPVVKELPVYSDLYENQWINLTPSFEIIHQVERKLIIHSSEGLAHARTALFYDKLNQIESFELEVIDPATKKTLEKAKLRDMEDAAVYSYSSIFDDDRRKYYELKTAKFPIEVTIKTVTKSKSNFFIPTWIPVSRANQKLQESSLTVVYPEHLGIRYKELNLLGTKEEFQSGDERVIIWKEKDLPVQAPDFDNKLDHRVLLAPVSFALENFVGKMDDWSGLAAWQYELNKGRGVLTPDFESKVREMVAHTDDPYEKTKILYDYLQKNFRYVSIQLGIGGWQTMTAKEVISSSYGDCKGLTNLMKSMLEAVGISSYPALVRAGVDAEDIVTDLPSQQFNHVILQVPMPNSLNPVWLECTSSLLPAGYLGDFTKNRNVLVTTPTGGYLTKTPMYDNPEWNRIKAIHEFKIDPQGNAELSSKVEMEGNIAEKMLSIKSGLDTRQQRDYFNQNSPVSGLIIQNYSLETGRLDSLPTAQLSYDGIVQKFVQSTAKRVILKSFMKKISEDQLTNNCLYQDDEYLIELPEVFQSDDLLEDLSYEDDFANISLIHSLDGKTLKISRSIAIKIPENTDKEVKDELLKKINAMTSKAYFFTKPTMSSFNE
jgi:hypothetical protein